jgi:hypothetical protein
MEESWIFALILLVAGGLMGLVGILLEDWRESWFVVSRDGDGSWGIMRLSPGLVLRTLGFGLTGGGLLIMLFGLFYSLSHM